MIQNKINDSDDVYLGIKQLKNEEIDYGVRIKKWEQIISFAYKIEFEG
jgi:hypothetical protein